MSDNPNHRNKSGFFNCDECGNPFHRAIGADRHDSLLSNIIMEIDRKGFRQRWPMAYFQCEACDALSAIFYEDHSGCISVGCMTVVKDMKGFRFESMELVRGTLIDELNRRLEAR